MLFLLVYVQFISQVCIPYSDQTISYQKMKNNSSLISQLQQSNPKAELSNRDIVLLLMEYCNDSIHDERGYIKDIINEKTDTVVTGLTRGLCDAIAKLTNVIRDQSLKISDLELKIDTLTSFNEQSLLHHIQDSLPPPKHRHVLQECSVCIRNPTADLVHDHKEHYHCNSCINVFKSVKELYLHQCTPHANFALEVCWNCGDTFDEEKFLIEHIVTVHEKPQVLVHVPRLEPVQTDKICELACQTESMSVLHNISNHGTPLIHNHISTSGLQDNLDGHTYNSVDQLTVHGNGNHHHVPEYGYHHQVPHYEQEFSTHHLANNIQDNQGHYPLSSCKTCGLIFVFHEDLLSHKCYAHSMSLDLHCNDCDSTFQEMRLLNIHIRNQHTVPPCSPCDKITTRSGDLETHLNPKHAAVPGHIIQLDGDFDADISDDHSEAEEIIVQLDGNTTLGDIEVSEDDPELLLSAYSMERVIPDHSPANQSAAVVLLGHQEVQSPATSITYTQVNPPTSMQYNYNLNKVNQTKRLLENSLRSPVEIRHGNYQNINGIKHPTSVTLDFNSGVYLAVIKPALEIITEGWNTETLGTVICCEEVSPRSDISGRKVCTKLVMYLTENNQRNKAVLHFYHTSSTLQVQGSSLMSSGSPTPVWFVENFILPLTAKYSSENQDNICEINTNIQQSVSHLCVSCKFPINPTAAKPKDQELSCNRCGNLFHKKCTDRWKTTAGWRRAPWYCSSCIHSTTDQVLSSQRSSISELENPQNIEPVNQQVISCVIPQQHQHTSTLVTRGAHAISALQPSTPTASTTRLTSTTSTVLPATSSTSPVLSTFSNSLTAITTPVVTTSIHSLPTTTTLPLPQTVQPSFPSASTRQRSTNINISNAEIEFQKTALNACRSTISQQETEIKRLKETLEIKKQKDYTVGGNGWTCC